MGSDDTSSNDRERQPFFLGAWRVDPDLCQLSQDGRQIHIEPRAMAVLCHLAARPNTTVSREDLFDAVWKTRYVGDEALTRTISQLRQALDDDPRQPRFLQTIPKLGYRLLVAPQPVPADVPAQLAAVTPDAATEIALPASRRRPAMLLALCVLVGLLATVWLLVERPTGTPNEVEAMRSPPATVPEHSVAILPFIDMSGDASAAAFADGMTEEIIQLLARVPGLRVPSRTSSFHFRDRAVELKVIGRELRVAHVLEGSIRRDGDRVRVTAQLVDARTDEHLWADTYERDLRDIFAIQQEIAIAIAQRLRISLGRELASRQPLTSDMVAYQLYIDAQLHRDRGRGPRQTIEMYEAAVERDPQFAAAWASLASAYWTAPGYMDVPAEQVPAFDRAAIRSAQRALELDDTLSVAHSTLADVDHSQRRYSAAEARHRRALASSPGGTSTHVGYAAMLGEVGRARESVQHMRIAWRLDPLSPDAAFRLARAHLIAGDDEEAQQAMQRARRLGFRGVVLDHMEAYVSARDGDHRNAMLIWARSAEAVEAEAMSEVFAALQNPVRRPQALAAIQQLPPWHPLPFRGRLFAACLLGDGEAAWQAATAGVEAGLEPTDNWWIEEAAVLRTQPRFQQLAEEMQFPPYWREYASPDKCRMVGDRLSCQ